MKTTAIAEEASAVSDEEFAWFQDYFGRKTGIYFEDNKRYFVDRRLAARMQATGHKSCLLYLRFVQFQPSQSEFQKLVNAMTVNETYFFREEYQLSALVDGVMDDVRTRKAPGESIRIWSMPCSTGEEPYSIAIYLMEHWPGMAEADVEIVGSDINSTVLEAARDGVFSDYALRSTPPSIVAKYFKQVSDTGHELLPEIRDAITFTQVNLTNPDETRSYRGFDIVFCRNLLIYFDSASRREAVECLYGAMNPGGYIFLGHSESMSRISSLFTISRAADALVYQKPL
jgi:chemotaxis protein methyltransferase CheR